MKLCVTFLLLLVILPTVTGEKSSERTLSGAKGDRGTCSYVGGECYRDTDCCGNMCCIGYRCVMTTAVC
nr:TPA_inf: conotoxin precursor I1 [Conus judaeus]